MSGVTTLLSNEVGEMDYAVNTSNGTYSLIGMPFASPSPSDAQTLAAQIGNVNTVLGWNIATQTFKTFTPGTGNFSFAVGDAIFVQVGNGAATSVNVVGSLSKPALATKPGGYSFVTMPLHCDELPNASNVASDITNLTNLLGWLQNTQTFRVFTPPSTGDFAVPVGAPFIVELNGSGPTSWPTIASACQ